MFSLAEDMVRLGGKNSNETRNVVGFTYRKHVNVRGGHGAECLVCAGEKGAAVVPLYQPAKLLSEPRRQMRGAAGRLLAS